MHRYHRWTYRTLDKVLGALWLTTIFGVASTRAIEVPSPSFEQGKTGSPAGWVLESGKGKWLTTPDAPDGTHAITVEGNGRDSGYWRSAPVAFQPNAIYEIRCMARRLEGASGGTPTIGPVFCNRDLGGISGDWEEYHNVFMTPTKITPAIAWLRFGQWHVKGAVAFDKIDLTRVVPVYRTHGDLVLGAGEKIIGQSYEFLAPFNSPSRNQSRPLVGYTAGFNTNRWVFGAGAEVMYRHEIAGRRQTRAAVDVEIGYYAGGALSVDVSGDGKSWQALGTAKEQGLTHCEVPGALLPAPAVWVRLRALRAAKTGVSFDPGSFQVHSFRYTATLDGPPVQVEGTTRFVAMVTDDPRLEVQVLDFGDAVPGGKNQVRLRLRPRGQASLSVAPRLAFKGPNRAWFTASHVVQLAPGKLTAVTLPYTLRDQGEIGITLAMGGGCRTLLSTRAFVPLLYDASYGERLPDGPDGAALWWALSGWKISTFRPPPERMGAALRIRAARNETEAAQLVVRPRRTLRRFMAKVRVPAKGPGGAQLPVGAFEVLRVRYVDVTRPSDPTGASGFWPDPLPPFRGPITVPAGRNQPLWVRVHVPRGAKPGVYRGNVRLEADGWSASAPFEVTVFDFSLPDRMTCQTAFGVSVGNIWRYHGVRDPAQRRELLERYWADYSAHHISPYDPAPLDPYSVSWPGTGQWQGGAHDLAMKHGGKSALRLADDSPKSNVSWHYQQILPIPAKGFRLRFYYRTKPGDHPFIVTLQHYDSDKHWISGHNNDIRVNGSADWKLFERTITRFPEKARFTSLSGWATLYAEDGHYTGTVWYDDISLVDLSTGKELLKNGGFEPLAPEALTPVVDWSAWDRAMHDAIVRWHFNTFRVRPMGMGGGTFYARREPSMLGYAENTPEYRTAFHGYWHTLEEHLRRNGWLDEAFVYWFDEPSPKDYEFVTNGFRKLEAAAPDLRRMLTEQVEPELVGGPNLWCPVLSSFQPDKAEERRKQGEHFWWYVCTGPKAPYPGLFIDHSGTDLRAWLWMSWKYKVEGILVWQSTYWTSPVAYPDGAHPQDPYRDPMGWVSGYGTPPGTKRPWGNGDGRFIYPPEAAADAHPAHPVMDGPVDSIRWEMLRDGIEDYEYLTILRRRLAAPRPGMAAGKVRELRKLLEVPAEIAVDRTHYTLRPEPIEARRLRVARAIEALGR